MHTASYIVKEKCEFRDPASILTVPLTCVPCCVCFGRKRDRLKTVSYPLTLRVLVDFMLGEGRLEHKYQLEHELGSGDDNSSDLAG